MKTGFNPYMRCSYNSNINFNGRIEKVIEKLKTMTKTEEFKNARITAEEALKIYNKIGFSTRVKAGAHVTITTPKGFEYSMTLPHRESGRFISHFDVRKLKCAILGDEEGLKNAIKF